MPYGGFWGTPREDEWHRRKEREYAREQQIRNDEQKCRNRLEKNHEDAIEAKNLELDLTKRVLDVARKDKEIGNIKSKKRRRIDTEEDDNETASLEANARENLLALSYAMYDSLYGTSSFRAKPFSDFLIKYGELALAEQIALAAVERDEQDAVAYALNEVEPQSHDSEALVESVSDIICESKSERQVKELMKWQISKGCEDQAFETALLLPDEIEAVKAALPFAKGTAQREKIKTTRLKSLKSAIKGLYDSEWPKFLSYALARPYDKGHYSYSECRIPNERYFEFASRELEPPRSLELARAKLTQIIARDCVLFNCDSHSPGRQTIQTCRVEYHNVTSQIVEGGLKKYRSVVSKAAVSSAASNNSR